MAAKKKAPIKLDKHDEQMLEWLSQYLGQLEGAMIENAGVAIQEWAGHVEFWPQIQVVTKQGRRLVLEVSQDEEGNGPGFVAGLPNPNGGRIVKL